MGSGEMGLRTAALPDACAWPRRECKRRGAAFAICDGDREDHGSVKLKEPGRRPGSFNV